MSNEATDRCQWRNSVAKDWEAFNYLVLWRDAVLTQGQRAASWPISNAADQEAAGVDLALLAVAANNTRRAAMLVRSTADQARWSDIDKATILFDQRLPDLQAIRNVLEHFDAYEKGRGRLQRPQRNGPLGVAPMFRFVEKTGETVRLHLSVERSRSMVLDVVETVAAVEELVSKIYEAFSRP
jgi:hypothetical protein